MNGCTVVVASDLGNFQGLGGGGRRMRNEPVDCYV